MANVAFGINVPEGMPTGKHIGWVTAFWQGVPKLKLCFELNVGDRKGDDRDLVKAEKEIRTIFASYASSDREQVLYWALGASTVGVSVFVDVLELRHGDDWETRLRREVPAHDLFCLFWSAAASRSNWVEKEWQCALEKKGVEYIHPVPFEDPRDVPPPPELGKCKHFEDMIGLAVRYERQRRRRSSGTSEEHRRP